MEQEDQYSIHVDPVNDIVNITTIVYDKQFEYSEIDTVFKLETW